MLHFLVAVAGIVAGFVLIAASGRIIAQANNIYRDSRRLRMTFLGYYRAEKFHTQLHKETNFIRSRFHAAAHVIDYIPGISSIERHRDEKDTILLAFADGTAATCSTDLDSETITFLPSAIDEIRRTLTPALPRPTSDILADMTEEQKYSDNEKEKAETIINDYVDAPKPTIIPLLAGYVVAHDLVHGKNEKQIIDNLMYTSYIHQNSRQEHTAPIISGVVC